MWQLDRAVFEPLLGAAHELVLEILIWAGHNHRPGTQANKLYRSAKTAKPKRLGEVARATDLHQHMAALACSQYLPEIKKEYEEITCDYEAFFEGGAHVNLSKDAREAAKPLFQYLYNDLLDAKCFWTQYVGRLPTPPSKQGFRQEAIDLWEVCPYCDFAKVVIPQHTDTDHVLPKSYFPVLAVYWKNLVVSCKACNESIKGAALIGTDAGKASNVPIFHPYLHQAADHLRFTFANDGKPEGPHPVGSGENRLRAENYVRLFKLGDIYPRLQPEMKTRIDEFLSKVADKAKLRIALNKAVGPEELLALWQNAAKHYAAGAQAAIGEQQYAKLNHDLYRHLEQHFDDYAARIDLNGDGEEDDW